MPNFGSSVETIQWQEPNSARDGHHAVAGLQMREQRRVDRRHAGRGGAAGFRAFDQAQPLLQHRQRRIGEARILVVIDGAGERALGLFRIVVDVA